MKALLTFCCMIIYGGFISGIYAPFLLLTYASAESLDRAATIENTVGLAFVILLISGISFGILWLIFRWASRFVIEVAAKLHPNRKFSAVFIILVTAGWTTYIIADFWTSTGWLNVAEGWYGIFESATALLFLFLIARSAYNKLYKTSSSVLNATPAN